MEASELKATKRTSSRSTASVESSLTTKARRTGTPKKRSAGKPANGPIKKGARTNGSKKTTSNGLKHSSNDGVHNGPGNQTGDRTSPAVPTAPSAQEAGHVGDVYDPECPSQKALETIATKWAILVLHTLIAEPMRFNKLQLTLSGISQKVLTNQLRKLERSGLVHRRVRPTSPPSVVYEITSAGHELRAALSGLCDWANKHAVALGIAQKPTTPSRC